MKLLDGITYSHEHVKIDLSGIKKNEDCRLDTFNETIEEFKELKSKGVANIIEVTNRGIGRDIEYIDRVAKESGLNILCSTGYYKEPFLPKEAYDLDEVGLSRIMIDEIINGIEGSNIKASIIGEVGTSVNVITPMEEKIFKASSRAHVDTGAPIITHTSLGTMGIEQLKIFESYGIDLDKVILSHVDLTGDLDYILSLIDRGCNVAFDTIGKENYQPDGLRIDLLYELCKRGLSEKILMSMDITRKSNLKSRGGIGYAYELDVFIPRLLERGVKQSHIDNMTKSNIVRILK